MTVLPQRHAERDVEDVESYVRETVRTVLPHSSPREREQLVARGIALVSRMARALPPETSLAALLDEWLGKSLAAYDRRRCVSAPLDHVAARTGSAAPAD